MISKLIDEIRATIVQSSLADKVLVGEIAYDYAEAVVACNDRLRRVMGLVDQGFVTEALAEADRDPPLLETVGLLEFPEREDWLALLTRVGIDPPPELRLDLAERLDEAYATNQGLEGLLKKHRLLALTRSSLGSRIAILRLICERDDQNLVWKQDLGALERARLKQIEVELSEQSRKRAFAEIEGLHQELTAAPWSVPIPQELVRKVVEARDRLFAGNQRDMAARAAAELREAFLAFDEARGAAALASWRTAIAPLGLSPSDPLLVDHRDAIAWAEEVEAETHRHEQFRLALAALVEVLDRRGDLGQLDRAEYRVRKLELPMPPVTAERVRGYRQQLEFRRKVRLIGTAVAIVLVSAGAIALVWLTVDRMRIGNQAIEVAARLDELVATNQIAAAESLVASLEEPVRTHSSVAPHVGKVEAAAATERDRIERRRIAIEAVEGAGWDSPDLDSLATARTLSQSDNERAEIATLELSIDRRQNELKMARETEFREKFTAFERQVRDAERDSSLESTERQLTQLKQSLERWRTETAGMVNGVEFVSDSERKRIDPLIKSIDTTLTRLRTHRQLASIADQATLAVGDVSGFSRSLESLKSTAGPGPIESELTTALAERQLWEVHAAWLSLLSDPRWKSYPAWSQKERDDFVTAAKALLVRAPITGIVEPVSDLLKQQESVGGPAKIDPSRHFERQAFVGVKLFRDSRERLFHAVAEPMRRGADLELQVYLDEDYIVGRERVPETKLEELGAAPQCRLFEELKPLLESMQRQELRPEVGLLTLIERVHAFSETVGVGEASVGLDPILRARLLRDLVADVRAIDPDLVYRHLSGYDGTIKGLGGAVNEDWLSPVDADAEAARKSILEGLDDLPPLDEIRASIKVVEASALPRPWPTCEYRWVGWLWREANGTYTVRSSEPLGDGPIYCLSGAPTSAGASTAAFAAIGEVVDRLPRLDGSRQVAGRPVYQKIPPPIP